MNFKSILILSVLAVGGVVPCLGQVSEKSRTTPVIGTYSLIAWRESGVTEKQIKAAEKIYLAVLKAQKTRDPRQILPFIDSGATVTRGDLSSPLSVGAKAVANELIAQDLIILSAMSFSETDEPFVMIHLVGSVAEVDFDISGNHARIQLEPRKGRTWAITSFILPAPPPKAIRKGKKARPAEPVEKAIRK